MRKLLGRLTKAPAHIKSRYKTSAVSKDNIRNGELTSLKLHDKKVK